MRPGDPADEAPCAKYATFFSRFGNELIRMRARISCLFPVALVAAALPLHAVESVGDTEAAPARNWVLPLFTNEGYHSITLRGDEVHPVGADRIEVVNINIIIFSSDAESRPVSILLSPEATFFARENRASGPSSVRLIRNDGEITGENWSYEQAGEKVSIRSHVHVVFKEPLNDLLK
jgi:hypothetical protein